MKLFLSFSARECGNCAQIIDFLKAPQDQVLAYKNLNTHSCCNCAYECFETGCKYRDDDVYDLYDSFLNYEKVILLVPMYCGNPCSLFFSFNERGQDYFMQHEGNFEALAQRLFIIGVYGSREESPDFVPCLERWFEGTTCTGHVLGIQRHLYRQKMQDAVIDVEAVRSALRDFIS